MRLSDLQAITLTHVLYDSCSIVNAVMGGLASKDRLELYKDILKQQDHIIIELSDLSGIPKVEDGTKKAPKNSPGANNGD